MKSGQKKKYTINQFIDRLQTLYSINSDRIFNIGEKSRQLGIFSKSLTYKEWLEKLELSGDAMCTRCGLPRHLGQCMGEKQ